jgi:hypothetical protein
VAGCCECGDEPSGSCVMELVSYSVFVLMGHIFMWFKLCIYLYLTFNVLKRISSEVSLYTLINVSPL